MKNEILLKIILIFFLTQYISLAQPRFGNNIKTKIEVRVEKLANNYFQYKYKIRVDSSSSQPLVAYTVEIGINNREDFNKILTDSILIKNWGCSKITNLSEKPPNFKGAEVTWVPLDTLELNSKNEIIVPNAIMPGYSIALHLITQSLPIIGRCWSLGLYEPYDESEIDTLLTQGYNESDLFKPWYSNALMGVTLCSYFPPSQFSAPAIFDTLISNIDKAHKLCWINKVEKKDIYLSTILKAKAAIEQSNNALARYYLKSVLQDVDLDSTSVLTSEAYALIKYNTEYLLNKIPIADPITKDLFPSITTTKTKEFTLSINGNNFTPASVIYFNGHLKKTIFVSGSLLTTELTKKETLEAGSYKVYIMNDEGNASGNLYLMIHKNLPEEVIPVLNCIEELGKDKYRAWFGYENKNDGSVLLDQESENKFDPAPLDREQPKIFLKGQFAKIFFVDFEGNQKIIWKLVNGKAKASKDSPRCK